MARQRLYVPTDSDNQQVATYITEPKKLSAAELAVRFTAFNDDNGKDDNGTFDSVIANRFGRRVVAINLPGIDSFAPKDIDISLTQEQQDDLQSGRFRKIGEATMQALQNTMRAYDINDPSYLFLSSCMGASVMAGSLPFAREAGMKIAGITIAEPINIRQRPMRTLLRQFADQPHAEAYRKTNPIVIIDAFEPTSSAVRRMFESGAANRQYLKAVTGDSFLSDAGDLSHLRGVPVHMSRGGASVLCPESEFDELVERFSEYAKVISVTHGEPFENPHDHPYVTTAESIASGAEAVIGADNNL